MNLRIGNIRNYNNKVLISSPSFKIGTNVKINLLSSENRRLNDDGEQVKLKDKPDVKSKEVDNQRLMVKSEPDVKQKRNLMLLSSTSEGSMSSPIKSSNMMLRW